ncbi:MAG TPA: GIY-YIG nuclease family protein [Gammaproteobacteria bacterium]|nr:GIY-YIG nuclease family protein [Gammaproteobacteria bacterium]
MSDWYVYIVRCADNSLYTGVAKELKRRVHEHNTCNRLGAKYTRGRRPVRLVFQQKFTSRSEACRFESRVKSLKKNQKEELVGDKTRPGSHQKNR